MEHACSICCRSELSCSASEYLHQCFDVIACYVQLFCAHVRSCSWHLLMQQQGLPSDSWDCASCSCTQVTGLELMIKPKESGLFTRTAFPRKRAFAACMAYPCKELER